MNRYVEAWLAAGVDPARAEELARRTQAGVIKDVAKLHPGRAPRKAPLASDYLVGEGYGVLTRRTKQGDNP